MKSIEQIVFEIKFPGDDYDANDYRDWAKENAEEAYHILLGVSREKLSKTQLRKMLVDFLHHYADHQKTYKNWKVEDIASTFLDVWTIKS